MLRIATPFALRPKPSACATVNSCHTQCEQTHCLLSAKTIDALACRLSVNHSVVLVLTID